jgi:2-polyprenyl-3-methyl-5-hydroxy-6-metoxy-1,4-benzoquinol methylase
MNNQRLGGYHIHWNSSLCLFSSIFYRFGANVMEVVASWTKSLCIDISRGHLPNHVDDIKSEPVDQGDKYLSAWSVLDIGTGNGLLLQEIAKQGYALKF